MISIATQVLSTVGELRHFFSKNKKAPTHGQFRPTFWAALAMLFFMALPGAYAQQVTVAKSVDNPNPQSGEEVVYTIEFGCSSLTDDCLGAVMVDMLPPGLEYVSVTPFVITTSMGPMTVTPVYDAMAHTLTWDFTALPEMGIPDGESATLELTMMIPNGSIANGTMFTNQVDISSTNAGSATASVPITVASGVDWVVGKTVTSGTIYHDQDVTYEIEVCPNSLEGNVNLTGAVLTDPLPPGADFVSATNGGVWDMNDPGIVTWNLGDLDVEDGCTTVEVVVVYPSSDLANNNTGLTMQIPKLNEATVNAGSVNGPVMESGSTNEPLNPPNFEITTQKDNHDRGILPIQEINHFTLGIENGSTVAVDDFTVVDDLPDQFDLTGVELTGFSGTTPPAISLNIFVELNGAGPLVLWQTGINPLIEQSFDATSIPGYNPPADYVSLIRFEFGTVPSEFEGDINLLVTPAWNGTGPMVDNAGNPVDFHVEYDNCVTVTATNPFDLSVLGPDTDCDHLCYTDRVARVNVDNDDTTSNNMQPAGSNTTGNPYLVGSEITYQVHLENDGSDGSNPTNITGAMAFIDLQNPVGSNLLPPGVTYIPSSWGIVNNTTGLPFDNSGANPIFEVINDYNGTGRTLLRWSYTGDFEPGEYVDVEFQVEIDNATAPGTVLTNDFCVSSATDFICDQQNCGNTETGPTLNNYFDPASGFTESCCQSNSVTVADSLSVPRPRKTVVSSGPYAPTETGAVEAGLATDIVEYEIRLENDQLANVILPDPIALDLLPTEMDYVANSLTLIAGSNTTGLALSDDGSNPTITVTEDYNGTGRTLLALQFSGDFPINTEVRYRFRTRIRPGASGNPRNTIYFTTNQQATDCVAGDTDVNDLDGDGDTTEELCRHRSSAIGIISLAALGARKFVKGPNDDEFLRLPDIASTNLNDSVSWRLEILNSGNQDLTDVVVYDIFPYVGDVGVMLNHTPRLTEWRPYLTEPVVAPAGVTVFYSQSRNPCRDDIDPILPTPDCVDDWTTTPPADLSTVEAIRLNVAGTLSAGESLMVPVEMYSPVDPLTVEARSIAWNSIGRNAAEVPAQEPNKVGIRLDYFDLALQKTLAPGQIPSVMANEDVTFRINIINQGGFPARNILVTDYVPTGLVFDDMKNLSWTGTFGATAPTFLYTNLIEPGDTGFVDIVLTVNPAAVVGDVFVNAAEIASSEDENGPVDDPDSIEDNIPGNDGNVEDDEIDRNMGDDEDDHDIARIGVTDCSFNITNVSVGPCSDNGMGSSLSTVSVELTWTNAPVGENIEVSLGGQTVIVDVVGGVTSPHTVMVDVFADGTSGNPISAGFEGSICVDFDGDSYDVPNPCGSDCYYDMGVIATCDDNGTTAQNDDRFIISLNPVGGGLGNSYSVTDDVDLSDLPYGFDIIVGIFDIADGNVSLTVTDDDDTDCEYSFIVPPTATCSAPITDLGDLPNSFSTELASNGPVHTLTPGLYLGTCVDPEFDGFPDAVAGTTGVAGDDLDNAYPSETLGTCTGTDDEDGVNFVTPLVPMHQACVEVAANTPAGAILNAWIDFNGDGDFDGDADEHLIFNEIGGTVLGTPTTEGVVPAGASTQLYCFDVPATVTFDGGETHARFRLSTVGGLGYEGSAADGEVEDYWLPLAKVGSYVWDDLNADGIQNEAASAGLDNVTLSLDWAGLDGTLGTADDVTYMTTTGANGTYYFCGLIAGDYEVGMPVVPAPYTAVTMIDQGSDDEIDGDDPNGVTFTIADVQNLPTGENSPTGDMHGVNNFPDNQEDLSFDFAYFNPAMLGDYVWEDLNYNGIQDMGEPAIEGVEVTLYECTGGVKGDSITTLTTNAMGYYKFMGLIPGEYCVEFDLTNSTHPSVASLEATVQDDPDGTEANDSDIDANGCTGAVTLAPGDNYEDLDAGYFIRTKWGDFAWHDKDGDGLQDGTESGLAGVDVTLTGNDGQGTPVTMNMTTDMNGMYMFGDLLPGTYKATFALPAGYVPSANDDPGANGNDDNDSDPDPANMLMTINHTLQSGDTIEHVDAGFYVYGKLGDFVWDDLNANGIQDPGEPGLPNVDVTLEGVNGWMNPISQTVTTDGSGMYMFGDLEPGVYRLTFEDMPDYQGTPQNASTGNFDDSDMDPSNFMTPLYVICSADTVLTVDAGFHQLATIGNFVWEDLNYNGVQDAGEPAIPGVNVTLTGTDAFGNMVTQNAVTDGMGEYSFPNLLPGDYKLTFDTPAGMVATALDDPASNGDDTDDSDADPANGGMTAIEVLVSGENNPNYDAGFYTPGQIGNFVWEDENGNGVQDPGEAPLPNVPVTLTGTNGLGEMVTLVATTDMNGEYTFDDLAPGDYKVTFGQPTGMVATALDDPATNGDDTSDSDADPANMLMSAVHTLVSGDTIPDIDAGFYTPAQIGNLVWEDENGNGVQDPGEPGIPGVDVTLTGTDGLGNMVNITVPTDANGMYNFGNLVPGDYKVTFSQPVGYEPTANDDPAGNGDDTDDSDADPANMLMSQIIPLASGDSIPTLDAGFYQLAKLGNRVWEDLNFNGIQDMGEPGIYNIPVTLTGTDGLGNAVMLDTTTNGLGEYYFCDLVPGVYTVTFGTPVGLMPTGFNDPLTLGDSVNDSDANPFNGSMSDPVVLTSGENNPTIDAGFHTFGMVDGIVWEDENANGVQDPGEPGIPGVPVTITGTDGAGNPVNLTIPTEPDGTYMFDGLPPGDYKVTFGQPSGTIPTVLNDPLSNGDDTNDSDADPANMLMVPTFTLLSGDSIPDIDAGFYTLGQIGNLVWEDDNANGVQDVGEPGIPGIPVTLTGTDGLGTPVSLMTNTDGNGNYTFDNLLPGDYKVTFGQPAGMNPTALDDPQTNGDDTNDSDADPANMLMTPVVNLTSGDTIPTLDAGFYALADVGNFVWEDENGNGVQDPGEPAIPGIPVTLTGTDGLGNPVSLMAVTDGMGNYTFDNLVPGNYKVTFGQPAGMVGTHMDDPAGNGSDANDSDADPANMLMSDPFDLNSGDSTPTFDAGFYTLGQIGNYVWDDVNGNGIQDAGEPGIPNVPVTLTGTDGVGNPVNLNTITDGMGLYVFGDLPPGNYKVTFGQPNGYGATVYNDPLGLGTDANDSDADPNNGLMSDPVALMSGDTIPTIDAGFRIFGAVGDYVWEDENGNGIQDAGEPGIPNVPVTLTGMDGLGNPVNLMTTTDGSGLYMFGDLAPGNYKVTFGQPTGMTATGFNDPASNGDSTNDSNANPANGLMSDPFALASGDTIPTLDAGFYTPAKITGNVWEDDNYNGVEGAGEPGIPGVTVTLTGTDALGNPVTLMAVTDANGDYIFDNLPPGNYKLTFGQPTGMEPTAFNDPAGNGSDLNDSDADPANGLMSDPVNLVSGDSIPEIDAGFYTLGKIGDFVWEDENGNGVQDVGEANIANVAITLTGTDGLGNPVNASGMTDGAGMYMFGDLPPGDYVVTFGQPADMVPTALDDPANNGDDTDDSDADPANGLMSANISLASGDTIPTIDAGFLALGKIGDFAWQDYDADGVQDAGEDPVAGITMTLTGTDNLGNPINRTVTTDGVGMYMFGDLWPGNYEIAVSYPAELSVTQYDPTDGDQVDDSDVDPVLNTISNIVINSRDTIPTLDVGLYGVDYGDAPNSFTTVNGSNGASHVIRPGKYLGQGVDAESDGQPDSFSGLGAGSGDDLNGSSYSHGTLSGSDEDGITFLTPLVPGHEACIEVSYENLSGDAYLTGWVDFDGDGAFGAAEQLMFDVSGTPTADAPLANGVNTVELCFDVPATATYNGGETHSRFRLSCETGVSASGQIIGGEVEDYWAPFAKVGNLVWLDYDFEGDQNESTYNGFNGVDVELTWAGNDGTLGTADDETYTTSTSNVAGEDGKYCFYGLIPGEYEVSIPNVPAGFELTKVDNTGDENLDADGTAVSFTIPNGFGLPTGENGVGDNPTGDNYPDTQTDLTFDFGFIAFDYGDLPTGFPTTDASNGAHHSIVPGMYLGQGVDSETDGAPENRSGFDGTGGDDHTPSDFTEGNTAGNSDEDGIEFVTPMIPGHEACVRVTHSLNSGEAMLSAWMDFNGDGDFAGDADEPIMFTKVNGTTITSTREATLSAGANVVTEFCFDVPADATFDGGETHVRFRMGMVGDMEADGFAIGGEVEDYWMNFAKVGNYVWFDTNYDGVQNDGPGTAYNGVDVTLTWAGEDGILGNADDRTYVTTSANINGEDGKYCFIGLTKNETYNLELDLPNGVSATIPAATNDVQDSDANDVTFTIGDVDNLPTGENGTSDAPGTGNNFPDAQDNLTFDFGMVAFDYGDLPNTFATLDVSNGASHTILPGMFLGTSVDSETDGNPAPQAGFDNLDGDNALGSDFVNGVYAGTDEDGIRFVSPMIPGQEACIEVTSNVDVGTGKLNLWIDFDGDGTFAGDADEAVTFTAVNGSAISATADGDIPNGTAVQTFCFEVPATATFDGGETHIRARLSMGGGLNFNGSAIGGEVEDYYLPMAKVGSTVWTDLNANGLQDEPASAGLDGVGVTLTAAGQDGVFGSADDFTYTSTTATVGSEPGIYEFCGLIEGDYRLEFDLDPNVFTMTDIGADDDLDSDGETVTFTIGHLADGLPTNEGGMGDGLLGQNFPDDRTNLTFDVGVLSFDYGDLPPSFGNTTLAEDGARHAVVQHLYLGDCVDVDENGQPDINAGGLGTSNGDDQNGGLSTIGNCAGDDENGIEFLTPMIAGNEACLEVKYTSLQSDAFLNAWIDFDGDGTFAADGSEQITWTRVGQTAIAATAEGPLAQGADASVKMCFEVPADAIFDGGETHLRFRLSSDGSHGPTGMAMNGEVEDYWQPFAQIGNFVWHDEDLNGDENEDPATYAFNDFHIALIFAGEDGILGNFDDIGYSTTTANLNGTDGIYRFGGLIPGTYDVRYWAYPQGFVSTIPDFVSNDEIDSDGFSQIVTIGAYPFNLPTGENSFGDAPNSVNNYPDSHADWTIDFGFVEASGVSAALDITGVATATSGECGHFDATMDICIENPGPTGLNNLQIDLDFASQNAFGTSFLGVTGAPQIVSSTASTDPVFNANFDGQNNTDLLNGTSGLLLEGEQICLRFTVEVNPEAANAPVSPSIQATVSGGAVNDNGMPIPDLLNGLAQYRATDLSDSGSNPMTTNPDEPGDSGEANDPTPLTNCWEASSTIACNDNVQISIGPDGTATIDPSMILEGEGGDCSDENYPLGSFYDVVILDEDGDPIGNSLTCADVGHTYTVQVTNVVNCGQGMCWGSIVVEDKIGPVFDCPTDPVVVDCDEAIGNTIPVAMDNCDSNPTEEFAGEMVLDSEICDDNLVTLQRVYTAFDDYGNEAAVPCTVLVQIVRPEVDFPNDIVWTCDQYDFRPTIVDANPLRPQITDSDTTTTEVIEVDPNLSFGLLSSTGSGVPTGIDGEYCERSVSHSDQTIFECGNSIKIVRTWTIVDWCNSEVILSNLAGEDNIQVIKVTDLTPPTVSIGDQTVNANEVAVHPNVCRSTDYLDAPEVDDNCNQWTVRILTPIGEAIYNNGVDGKEGGTIPAPGLEIGTHTVTYEVSDECGNQTVIDVTVTVEDMTAPVAVCDEITEVTLDSDEYTEVFAETFDDGSYDNCCLDYFEVRRMDETCDDGHDDTIFDESVRFCCADVGEAVTVVFRAVDCNGNVNECMVQVNVDDKQSPVLIDCPANQRILCDVYADDLETQLANAANDSVRCAILTAAGFGEAIFQDNCELEINCNVSINLDQCLEGTISRSWSAEDAAGNSALQSCNQTIFVDHVSDWVVEFPADITVNCGTTVPDFGEPEIFFETCELVAVSFEDEVFTTVPDACYKILRTWTVINWCVVGDDLDEEFLEDPENAIGLPFPECDLDGDGDCDNRTFRDSWASGTYPDASIATQTTGPDTDFDSDPWDGYITYQQTIKVIDDVDPVFTACEIPDVCIEDNTCAATVLLPEQPVDECSTDISLTAEIEIGGTWLEGFGPFLNVNPGTYDVRYTAMDNCNNQTVCETTVTVKDCKKPTPYCKNGIIVEIMQTFMVEVWAADLNDGSFDNCPGDLTLSFSSDVDDQSIVFECEDVGQNPVQLWVTDVAGNQDFCETFVVIQDNMVTCDDDLLFVGGTVATEDNEGVEGVEISLNSPGGFDEMALTELSGAFNQGVEAGHDYTVTPTLDVDPLNGVTTFDLVLISKHILGVQPLDSPYKMIAADANKSNTITTFDLLQLRKLILFIDLEFPSNTSWRFVDAGYDFPNLQNPWAEEFPEVMNFNNLDASELAADFVAVKIGDVNGSAATNLLGSVEDRDATGSLIFDVDEMDLTPGKAITVDFKANDFKVLGYQFTLNFDPELLEFVEVGGGLANAQNFGLSLLEEGAITTSWNEEKVNMENGGTVFSLTFRSLGKGKLSHAIHANGRFTPAEAYRLNGEVHGISLEFNGEEVAAKLRLYQNNPNPFRENTAIGFDLPNADHVTLTVTDMTGRVLHVVEGDYRAGYHEIELESSVLKSIGVLRYTLETSTEAATRQMLLAR